MVALGRGLRSSEGEKKKEANFFFSSSSVWIQKKRNSDGRKRALLVVVLVWRFLLFAVPRQTGPGPLLPKPTPRGRRRRMWEFPKRGDPNSRILVIRTSR